MAWLEKAQSERLEQLERMKLMAKARAGPMTFDVADRAIREAP